MEGVATTSLGKHNLQLEDDRSEGEETNSPLRLMVLNKGVSFGYRYDQSS